MGKDPAFLFYPGDWLGGTIGMTFEQKGAYMELLMMQFNRGHMTTHMIGQVVGHHWDTLKDKFKQDENGLWYNERLDIEKEKRKNFVNSRNNNKSGSNQYTKTKKNKVAHTAGHMTGHMENENRNENTDNNKGETFSLFKDLDPLFIEMVRDASQEYPISITNANKGQFAILIGNNEQLQDYVRKKHRLTDNQVIDLVKDFLLKEVAACGTWTSLRDFFSHFQNYARKVTA